MANQRSIAVRFRPLGRMRIPNRSSPGMMGSAVISGSCAAKPRHHTRIGRRLRRLVQTLGRPDSQRIRQGRVEGHEEVLLRTGEQPVRGGSPTIETHDVELQPRFDTAGLLELCRQNDLAPAGDGGLYGAACSSLNATLARLLRRCLIQLLLRPQPLRIERQRFFESLARFGVAIIFVQAYTEP